MMLIMLLVALIPSSKNLAYSLSGITTRRYHRSISYDYERTNILSRNSRRYSSSTDTSTSTTSTSEEFLNTYPCEYY